MKYETVFQSIIPRTPNVFSYRFSRPADFAYKPGQYFYVTLKSNGQEIGKHFSFSSSPTEANFIEFTKRLSDSQYSATLRASKPGDWARIDGPYGQFTFEGEYPKIALLAGGIGITPFISIIRNATDKKISSQIVLFYGNRSPSDITFRSEFEDLAKINSNIKNVFTVNEAPPDWKGQKGFINADLIKRELPDYLDYVFYVCGPPPMVAAVQKMVESIGLPKEKLKLEYFTGYS